MFPTFYVFILIQVFSLTILHLIVLLVSRWYLSNVFIITFMEYRSTRSGNPRWLLNLSKYCDVIRSYLEAGDCVCCFLHVLSSCLTDISFTHKLTLPPKLYFRFEYCKTLGEGICLWSNSWLNYLKLGMSSSSVSPKAEQRGGPPYPFIWPPAVLPCRTVVWNSPLCVGLLIIQYTDHKLTLTLLS